MKSFVDVATPKAEAEARALRSEQLEQARAAFMERIISESVRKKALDNSNKTI